MRRREVITLLGGAAAAWPLAALAKTQRIAILNPAWPVAFFSNTTDDPLVKALFNELGRAGYVEGQNLLIERYSGEGRAKHYPELARDVVRSNPDLILALDTTLNLDLKGATTTIPIVGIFGYPVEAGVVGSLARPGGNITGVAVNVGYEQWDKRYQLLRQLVPHMTTMAVIETRPYREGWEDVRPEFGRRHGLTYVGTPLEYPINEDEYRRLFASLMKGGGADGIVATDEVENVANAKVIVELAEKNRLPAIYPFKRFVIAGGLMSYGVDEAEVGHNAGVMVGQILKGAKPADIPVRQPTKFELVINLKTAKALGLTVPDTLLVAADEVIE